MKGITAFTCMSDIDVELIEESMEVFSAATGSAIRGGRRESSLIRFLGSGWGVALICAVVSLSVLAAIIRAGQSPLVTPPDGGSSGSEVTEPEPTQAPTEEAPPEESAPTEDTTEDTAEDEVSDTEGVTAESTEEATEEVTEGVFHPDVTEGGVLFVSNGDGTCSVKGADKSYKGVIVVPAQSPFGDTVTTVSAAAFRGCNDLTAVHLPDTVTVIKAGAFQRCGSLENVTLPPVVTEFGKAMFEGCGELREVILPAGLTEIPAMTFQTCVSLTRVVAQEGVTAIGANAFNGCRSMGTLTIPAGLKSIGSSAFQNCCGLHTVYYGGSRAEWERVDVESVNNAYIRYVNVVFGS